MGVTQVTTLNTFSALVQQTSSDFYLAKANDKSTERKAELQLQHIADELVDCINKSKNYFVSKFEIGFRASCDPKDAKKFCEMQVFGLTAADGLKSAGFKVQTVLASIQ